MYRIIGVDATSGVERVVLIEAADEDAALVAAKSQGVLVCRVEVVAPRTDRSVATPTERPVTPTALALGRSSLRWAAKNPLIVVAGLALLLTLVVALSLVYWVCRPNEFYIGSGKVIKRVEVQAYADENRVSFDSAIELLRDKEKMDRNVQNYIAEVEKQAKKDDAEAQAQFDAINRQLDDALNASKKRQEESEANRHRTMKVIMEQVKAASDRVREESQGPSKSEVPSP